MYKRQALGGVDTLVFTAGIGENDAKMRKDILTGMEWLGIQLDDEANQRRGEHKISAPDSKVEVWVCLLYTSTGSNPRPVDVWLHDVALR